MLYIMRNNQRFGPYDLNTILTYVNNGQILLQDTAIDDSDQQINTIRYFLKKNGHKAKVTHAKGIIHQLKIIGSELIVPKDIITHRLWRSDNRLLILAVIGLMPLVLMLFPFSTYTIFYTVSLYFACLWGLLFYYLFKTAQVSVLSTLTVFFLTQIFIFFTWNILGIPYLNPFYLFINSGFPLNFLGYIFGVGLTEEVAKLLPLLFICHKSKEPIIPQTSVYYGLMSGIAFGVFEGVQYQLNVNITFDYTGAFFLNVLRLTSLPFLHAIWCGIAGYFIAFAKLYPKYRKSLYFLAIFVPAFIHGVYDTLCHYSTCLAILVTLIAVILLMTYLKQGVNYQSKLCN